MENDLAGALRKAIERDKPQTLAERAENPDMVALVLNPGSYSAIGNEKFKPGAKILVLPDHAERLTSHDPRRAYAAARYLDEPEPDARGNFPQIEGAGRYHPESKHHKAPESEPVELVEGQTLKDGQIVEPVGVVVASEAFPVPSDRVPADNEDPESKPAASPPGRRKSAAGAGAAVGDGGKTS